MYTNPMFSIFLNTAFIITYLIGKIQGNFNGLSDERLLSPERILHIGEAYGPRRIPLRVTSFPSMEATCNRVSSNTHPYQPPRRPSGRWRARTAPR